MKTFLSYAWGTPEENEWVRHLADTLQQQPDIEVVYDQYDLWPGRDLTRFMEQIATSDRVLVVLDPKYREKAIGRTGGVGYENLIITGDIYRTAPEDKFIPILRGLTNDSIPPYLATRMYVDMQPGRNFREGVEEILRALRRTPPARRPPKIDVRTAGQEPSTTDLYEDALRRFAADSDFRAAGIEVRCHRQNVRITSERHDYRLIVTLHNTGHVRINDFRVEVHFPAEFLTDRQRNEVERIYEKTEADLPQKDRRLYPKEEVELFEIDYYVDNRNWPGRPRWPHETVEPAAVRIKAYASDLAEPWVSEVSMAELNNF